MLEFLRFEYLNQVYTVNINQPIDISIPIQEGVSNPNCYYAQNPVFETIRMGDFVGSVAEGGACNYQKITITPHGNGTHTECYGHISSDVGATIYECLKKFFFKAELISISPQTQGENQIITFEDFLNVMPLKSTEAVIIRTKPNTQEKLTRQYSNTNPPFLDSRIGQWLAQHNILHLLVDLPSVDKEVDGGVLSCHKAFWQFPNKIRKEATITELVYIPDEIVDGSYLLNLQVTSLQTDASPSKPIIYKLL